jgi:hypothetical protein
MKILLMKGDQYAMELSMDGDEGIHPNNFLDYHYHLPRTSVNIKVQTTELVAVNPELSSANDLGT